MSFTAALLRAFVLIVMTNVVVAAVWLIVASRMPPTAVAVGAAVAVVVYDRLVVQRAFDGERD